MCFVHLLLLELDQATGIVFNTSYYFHCQVLRHLPNAERSEFQTGRSMFICLQRHFSRAASCGHTIIRVVPAAMSHASKLKGPTKTDLQDHTHCFPNRFSLNHREKYFGVWVYKALFLPKYWVPFFSDSLLYILTKSLQADRSGALLYTWYNRLKAHFVLGFLFVHWMEQSTGEIQILFF